MIKYLLLITALTFLACGGGSSSDAGGSSSSSISDIFGTDIKSASSGVRLLHGAIDAAPVDLLSTSKEGPLSFARFSLAQGFSSVSGTQIVSVVPHNTLSPTIFQSEVTIAKGSRDTFLLYGNNRSIGLQGAHLPDARNPDLGKGSAAARVIHALIGASQLQISIVGGVSQVAVFGRASAYSEVPAGANNLTVTRVADGQTVYSAALELAGGKHYSVFVSGDTSYYTTARVLED